MRLGIFLPNWIGDVVMATPALDSLRHLAGDEGHVVGVMRPYVNDVVEGLGYFDRTIHYKPKAEETKLHSNPVDGKDVPVPHYGVVLPWDTFENFATELRNKDVKFVIEPYVRFKGEVGEQATMFFLDPAGNALEFKAFKDMNQLFAK